MNKIAQRLTKVANDGMALTKDTLNTLLTPGDMTFEHFGIFYIDRIKDFFEQAFEDGGKAELGFEGYSFDEAADAYAEELGLGTVDLDKDQLLILPDTVYIAGNKSQLVDALYEYLKDDPGEELWNKIVKRFEYTGH